MPTLSRKETLMSMRLFCLVVSYKAHSTTATNTKM